MEKRCDGCGEKHERYFGTGSGHAFCRPCIASLAASAGVTVSDAEREVLRLAREWGASLRRGDEQRAPVDLSPLVAAVMRLGG